MNVYLGELYKEVQYIQSSGTQYIDTGYILSSNSIIKTKLNIVSGVGSYDMQYGSYGTSGDKPSMFMQRNYPDNNKLRAVNYSNSSSERKYVDSINNLVFNTDYNIEHTNTSFIINGVSQGTMYATTYTCDKTAYIFGAHTKRGIECPSAMKLYSFKIYESGTLVRDFVPCYRLSDNAIGLFDKVGNKFYTNAGTGTFTKGADVKTFQPELKNAYIGEVWQPGANTFLYIPLNSVDTYNNVGGTAPLATNASGTITYSTKSSNIEVGNFISAYVRYSTSTQILGNSFTIAFWTKLNSYSGTLVGMGQSGYSYSNRIYVSNGYVYFFDSSHTMQISTGWAFVWLKKTGNSITYGLWRKGSIGSGSITKTLTSSDITFGDGISGAMSNIVVEQKEWSTTELNNYYNSTKDLYTL